MNVDEVKSLLKSAIRRYLAPDTIRPSESVDDAARRQSSNIRELFEELKRYIVTANIVNNSNNNNTSGGAPAAPKHRTNEFHAN
jgi:hypothetical protein